MKKYETKYSANIGSGECYDSVEFIVDELGRLQVKSYQDRRRTKEEHIQLYENIIKELKEFNE